MSEKNSIVIGGNLISGERLMPLQINWEGSIPAILPWMWIVRKSISSQLIGWTDAVKLADLWNDVVAQLPEERRKAMEALVEEYGAGETLRFLLALVAGTNPRERQLIRLFLRELDKLDQSR